MAKTLNGPRHQGAALTFAPVTPDRWPDMERLFGPRGACAGCWCMYWRLNASQYQAGQGEKNKRAMHKLVSSGRIPGIIGYSGNDPIGWCSIAPREDFPRFETSRTLKPIDEQPVWSVACLFVARPFRRSGVSVQLLKAAADYARSQGARIVEGYPKDPRNNAEPDAFVWTGLTPAFRKAGFKEVARPAPTRAIMRRKLQD